MKTRKVKTSSLILWLVVGLIFSILIGVTGGAMGLGSRFPRLNLIVGPFLCPGAQMSYTQNVSEIGTATYWTADWVCVDEQGGTRELDPDTVFYSAGPIYGLAFFVLLLVIVYIYWNSSIGPARNDGLRLW
jgi:hypothetical protein